MNDLVVTRGGGLTATVDPSRGAKIVSLLDDTGREWLAAADPSRPVGRAFTEAEMAGWDECAPSIVACEVDGRSIPDHGDLWDSAFEMEGDLVRGAGDGYTFHRSVEATPSGLRLNYRAVSERSMPFLWAAHPQFVAPPGSRVVLPGDVAVVIEVIPVGPVARAWGPQLAGLDGLPPGGFRKVYLEPHHPVEWASLVRPDGAALTMRWSRECPFLGLWFDNAAFSREPVIAIEPSTGYYDSVADAARADRVVTLVPGVPLEWWVDISVSTASCRSAPK